ncbi:MAG: DUF5668 domain-containing protein [Candidatus Kapabacteria bacterium]|nr:DUF5668 domain-containing protein [Candidatus Kapabacteria bacterium]
MKTGTIFWGVFLITLGIMLLISSLNSFALDLEFIFKLWPLIFIFWGLTLLKISDAIKKIIVIFISVLLALFIVALVNTSVSGVKNIADWDWDINVKTDDTKRDYDKSNLLSIPFDSNQIERNLSLDIGAGSFSIEGGSENLIEVFSKSKNSQFNLESDSLHQNISFSYTEGNINFDGSDKRMNKAILKINENPLWNFDIKLGAAKMSADFSRIKSRRINFETGAASSKIKLGEMIDTCDFVINAGASSVKLEIPKNSGCIVETDMALSSRKFEGLNFDGNNFKSENYDKAEKKIFIKIKGGVSSFKITRY